MPDSTFAVLREELLLAGIAPRHARRLMLELHAHYELLIEEELRRGNTDLAAASIVARVRLGSDADIVRKTLEQPELRSWGTRLPCVSALAPPLGLAASLPLAVGLFVMLVAIANYFYSQQGAPGGLAGGGLLVAMAVMPWLVLYGLPLVWAGILAWYAALVACGGTGAQLGCCSWRPWVRAPISRSGGRVRQGRASSAAGLDSAPNRRGLRTSAHAIS